MYELILAYTLYCSSCYPHAYTPIVHKLTTTVTLKDCKSQLKKEFPEFKHYVNLMNEYSVVWTKRLHWITPRVQYPWIGCLNTKTNYLDKIVPVKAVGDLGDKTLKIKR